MTNLATKRWRNHSPPQISRCAKFHLLPIIGHTSKTILFDLPRWFCLDKLLMEEILHHLGCTKPCKNNGINYQPQLVKAGFLNHQKNQDVSKAFFVFVHQKLVLSTSHQIDSLSKQVANICARSKLLRLGMVIPPSIGNPYNGHVTPYYWVDFTIPTIGKAWKSLWADPPDRTNAMVL